MKRALFTLLMLTGCTSMKDSNRPDEPQAFKQTYDRENGVNFGMPPKWKGREAEWKAAGSPPFNPEDLARRR